MWLGLILPSFVSGNEQKIKNSSVEVDSVHDHEEELPAIECPLLKQGIDPHSLKPFEDVQKYIDFLDREDREIWQKPDTLIQELGLNGVEKIADIGAGSGYFTFRLSKLLPAGKVYAIDIEPEMVRHIHHTAVKGKYKNIEVLLATEDNPNIPSDVDLVFVCDVLHHVRNSNSWLKKVYAQMKKGSRLVLIEFKEGKLPEGPPEDIKISLKKMISIVENAGFMIVKQNVMLLPFQYYLEFKKES